MTDSDKFKSCNVKIKIKKCFKASQRISPQHHGSPSAYSSYFGVKDSSLKLRINRIITSNPKGYRLINFELLHNNISEITMHVCLRVYAMEVAISGAQPLQISTG